MARHRTLQETAAPPDGTALYRVSRYLLGVLFRYYNRWEVAGREHIPDGGGVLLIANHTSYADPPIAGPACRRPVNFMAKSELFRIPLLSAFIRRTHAFPVQRGAADQPALRRAVRLLQRGNVLLIFPEGTRSPDGRLQPFEPGAAFIALASGAAVVPMGIDGADRLLPRGKPILLPGKLRVRFGPAVDLSPFRGRRRTREILQQACDHMHAAVAALLPPHRLPR
ncbi:MAG TPA: lysophospholipid acyltransferase family protein [Armatimonadota bacterium]|nr:lysophospholipid acyltransferase family protein [Armatimonadota bacterium]